MHPTPSRSRCDAVGALAVALDLLCSRVRHAGVADAGGTNSVSGAYNEI